MNIIDVSWIDLACSEMGVYQTKYSGSACDILKKNHRVAAIPGVGDSVFYLSSPNKQNAEETKWGNPKQTAS